MGEQPPSLGRIVRFKMSALGQDTSFECAAIITDVWSGPNGQDGHVSLTVFHPERGPLVLQRVPYSPELKASHWTWPPRTP